MSLLLAKVSIKIFCIDILLGLETHKKSRADKHRNKATGSTDIIVAMQAETLDNTLTLPAR